MRVLCLAVRAAPAGRHVGRLEARPRELTVFHWGGVVLLVAAPEAVVVAAVLTCVCVSCPIKYRSTTR